MNFKKKKPIAPFHFIGNLFIFPIFKLNFPLLEKLFKKAGNLHQNIPFPKYFSQKW